MKILGFINSTSFSKYTCYAHVQKKLNMLYIIVGILESEQLVLILSKSLVS